MKIAFKWLLWITIRDINVNLIFITFVYSTFWSTDYYSYLLQEFEIVGQNLVKVLKVLSSIEKVKFRALHTPTLIAASFLFTLLILPLTLLFLIILADQRNSLFLFLLVEMPHDLANEHEFYLQPLLGAFAQPRCWKCCD